MSILHIITNKNLSEERKIVKLNAMLVTGLTNNFSERFYDGNTPLLIAIDNNYELIVEYLVSICKVDCDVQNNLGDMPIFVAISKQNIKMVFIIVRYYVAKYRQCNDMIDDVVDTVVDDGPPD